MPGARSYRISIVIFYIACLLNKLSDYKNTIFDRTVKRGLKYTGERFGIPQAFGTQ